MDTIPQAGARGILFAKYSGVIGDDSGVRSQVSNRVCPGLLQQFDPDVTEQFQAILIFAPSVGRVESDAELSPDDAPDNRLHFLKQ